ncbi:hypothetical protein FRC01_009021 [Tulasnella sp. 417]|nr:hypothetical protein FRC01_009021 [Tulasnella sp. 417]
MASGAIQVSASGSELWSSYQRGVRLMLGDIEIESQPFNISGHFGDVFRGKHPKYGVLALKRLRVGSEDDNTDRIRRFSREGETWQDLVHPNILPFLGIDWLGDHIYLISPFAEHGTVMDYLKRNPDTDRPKFLLEIAAAVAFLHFRHVIHGDIKGRNVLVSPDLSAQVCDFGLSRYVDSATSTGMIGAGTTRWSSPEVIDGGPKSYASDVYAFACSGPPMEIPRNATFTSRIYGFWKDFQLPVALSPIWATRRPPPVPNVIGKSPQVAASPLPDGLFGPPPAPPGPPSNVTTELLPASPEPMTLVNTKGVGEEDSNPSPLSENFGFMGVQSPRVDGGGGWLIRADSDEDDEHPSQFDLDPIEFTPGLYKALYPFEPEGSAEMGLEEDQEVRCLCRYDVSEGWLVAVKEVTNSGEVIHALVPEAYMQLIRPLEDYELGEAMGKFS